MAEQTMKVEWQVDEAVNALDADWQAQLVVLAATLDHLRTGEAETVKLTEDVNKWQREIDDLESAAVLAETGENGVINGKNESTRKAQREALLKTMRQEGGKTWQLCRLVEAAEYNLREAEMRRKSNLDTVTLQKLKLEHIDAVLKAIAG